MAPLQLQSSLLSTPQAAPTCVMGHAGAVPTRPSLRSITLHRDAGRSSCSGGPAWGQKAWGGSKPTKAVALAMEGPPHTQPAGAWLLLLPCPHIELTETNEIQTEPRHLYCPWPQRYLFSIKKKKKRKKNNPNNKKYTSKAVQTLTLEGISNNSLGQKRAGGRNLWHSMWTWICAENILQVTLLRTQQVGGQGKRGLGEVEIYPQ